MRGNRYTTITARQVVEEACRKHPSMPARRLARQVYAESPELFPNEEAARSSVRYVFGAMGEKNAKHAAVPREKRNPQQDWRKFMPSAKRTIDLPWGPVRISGPCKTLILSDLHVPFYNKKATELAIEYGLKRGADAVLLNGDIVDHYALSRWQKDPRLRSFADEVQDGRAILKTIRQAFPDARIHWKLGNHEERYEAYMISQAPQFLGVEAFEWGSVFGLEEQDVRLVTDKRPIALGKLNIVHGHEFGKTFADPVSPARTFFLKGGSHVLGGHFHQTSQHSKNNIEQNVVSTWSTGALCEEHPRYHPINGWNLGFAFVETDHKGAFEVENKRIVGGRIW